MNRDRIHATALQLMLQDDKEPRAAFGMAIQLEALVEDPEAEAVLERLIDSEQYRREQIDTELLEACEALLANRSGPQGYHRMERLAVLVRTRREELDAVEKGGRKA